MPTKPRGRNRWWIPAFVALLVVSVLLGYSLAETYRLEFKEVAFADPDVPPGFDGVRVAFITDIHRGPYFSQDRVRKLVERVNALKPDMIILGGDYVYGDTAYMASCFSELRELKAPFGRYAVLGNHDYGDYQGPTIDIVRKSGISLLYDEGVWLDKDGDRIRIGGVSDLQLDLPRIGPVTNGTEESDFVLLVSHNPDFAEQLEPGAVDVMLSGHTHGGQVTFFGLWAPYLPSDYGQKYRTGRVEMGATTVFISNGVGTSTFLPVRFFARPQVLMFTLERTATAN